MSPDSNRVARMPLFRSSPEKVFENAGAGGGRFFRMKLTGGEVIVPDDGREALAMAAGGDCPIDRRGEAVDEIEPFITAEAGGQRIVPEIPFDLVDEVILCDDASRDNTVAKAKEVGIQHILVHEQNKGYGGNQKSLYNKALELGADIVIMLHPDYQYTPKLIPSMVNIIGEELYPVVLGSRILGRGALAGGMPLYKYIANRFLTFTQNLLVNYKLSEYHTGYRAFDRKVLEAINFNENSDDFVFDNEMLSQIIYAGFHIGEVTCPTKYFEEASSINLPRSIRYGLGVLRVSLHHFLQRWKIANFKMYEVRR